MIEIFPNIEELNNFAGEKFVEIADNSINSEIGNFTVALSGGATPKSLYKLLVSDKFRNRIDWTKVFFFFGDERNVPRDDEESNFKMARENLFEPLQINRLQIIRWKTELENPRQVAHEYENNVLAFFEVEKLPRFDLILLGMGADGHTASLFPNTKALHETERLAVANYVEKLDTIRLTLTFPVINNAANVMFLVSGEEKAESLREVLQGEPQPDKFPAQNVKLNDGNLLWLIDSSAARLLQ